MTREEKLRSVFLAQHGTIEVPCFCRHQECGNSGFATEFVCQDDDDKIGIDSDAINNKDNTCPFIPRTNAKKYNPPFV